MMLTDILQTLIFALLFTFVFIAALWKRKPRFGILALFMLLFLSIWAGGVWMSPFDGGIWNRPWPAFFFTGFFVALLLVAVEAGAPLK